MGRIARSRRRDAQSITPLVPEDPLENYRLNPTRLPLESACTLLTRLAVPMPRCAGANHALLLREGKSCRPLGTSVGRGSRSQLLGRQCATPGRRRVIALPAVLAKVGRHRDRMPPTMPLIQKGPWGIANPSESETNIR